MTGDSSSKLKEKKADCKERIQDNRSTHFQFGSDEEPKYTEQVQNSGAISIVMFSDIFANERFQTEIHYFP